ncbi:hypothetical protein ACLB2K_052170 [Fragaria x ananassa]
MELMSGFRLLLQQFTALFKKNLLLAWRHKVGTTVHLFSSFFFILLILCIEKAINVHNASSPENKNVTDPDPLVSPPIPPCEDKDFIKKPCYDFVWSGDDPLINDIVDAIRDNNPSRRIPAEKVKAFRTPAEVDEWLLDNPKTCPGALHFTVRSPDVISYGVQTNSTQILRRGDGEDPTFKFQIPLQIAAEREIFRHLIDVPDFSWNISFKEFPHPAREVSSAMQNMGPVLFLASAMFAFVFQMTSLITEKELKLRGISNRLVFLPPNLLAKALQILAIATDTPQRDGKEGIRLSKVSDCEDGHKSCVITIGDIYKWLVATFFLWFLLAIYFDNIVANASGMKKPMYYFSTPSCWLGSSGGKVQEGNKAVTKDHIAPEDVDVLEEENLVKQQSMEGTLDPKIAVQISGLVKIYPGKKRHFCCCCCCCRCKETKPYTAVKGLWVNFPKDQLFCLLGPNGAGKSTTISCLTGIAPITGGDALIYDHSARSTGGMAAIRKLIGVCPQFDVLWKALTGKDHLHLFAKIKGLSPSSVEMIAHKSLEDVKLSDAASMRAGSYSGGMKRRLSVAMAFIGDPKLIILDEPTTGMDPITRRHVWDIIEEAKKGRSILLTTHSMEEADILSDRIGIMAKGKLRCIRTSIRLKSRFGSGFIANVSFRGSSDPQNHESVKHFFKQQLDVIHKNETNSYLTFVIPQEKEGRLPSFFAELEDRQQEFGIADIQLGLTTLEEVFLNISRQAELDAAMAEGRLVTLTLTSGESVEIPVGAKYAMIPKTESEEHPQGLMVEVYWDQDETGKLCIAGHSSETPVPRNIDPRSLH